MTIIASLVIEAATDTILQSQGFDEASFLVFVAGGLWRIQLDAEVASASPLRRQVVVIPNNPLPNVRGVGTNSVNLISPTTEVNIAILNNVTNVVEPLLAGTQTQVYLTVTRMFREPG